MIFVGRDIKNKIEAAIDWESARFTKPDKPLGAYDTWKEYYSDIDMEPTLKLFRILETKMKKKLKAECFTNVNELCNFVNEKKISQENIQTIIETAVYDQVCITLYYWEIAV